MAECNTDLESADHVFALPFKMFELNNVSVSKALGNNILKQVNWPQIMTLKIRNTNLAIVLLKKIS